MVNADEVHREIEITVGQNSRSIDIIQGYQNTVISRENLYNNEPAFNEFLYAINGAGFTEVNKTSFTNETGVCPLGNRYDFNLNQNGKNISSLWSATCTGVGTSAANQQLVIVLFQNQIPDYANITANVNLNATSTTFGS